MSDTRKISAHHLKRKAYLYIRQSTVFQIEQNRESTERQYRFREQAVALGWHPEQVVVIDDDLGQSAAEADRRPGFQRLVADVSLGLVGIVLSLEVSRLARNCSDWHRLLELCALERHAHPGRGRAVRPEPVQRPPAAGAARHHERGRAALPARPPGGRQAEQGAAAASCGPRCPSVCSTTARGGSCWTPIARSRRPSAASSTPSRPRGAPG